MRDRIKFKNENGSYEFVLVYTLHCLERFVQRNEGQSFSVVQEVVCKHIDNLLDDAYEDNLTVILCSKELRVSMAVKLAFNDSDLVVTVLTIVCGDHCGLKGDIRHYA